MGRNGTLVHDRLFVSRTLPSRLLPRCEHRVVQRPRDPGALVGERRIPDTCSPSAPEYDQALSRDVCGGSSSTNRVSCFPLLCVVQNKHYRGGGRMVCTTCDGITRNHSDGHWCHTDRNDRGQQGRVSGLSRASFLGAYCRTTKPAWAELVEVALRVGLITLVLLLSGGTRAFAVDALSVPSSDDVAAACKVLLDRTAKAAAAADGPRVILLTRTYDAICGSEDLPVAYATFFETLRKNNSAIEARCFSLTGPPRTLPLGFRHREIDDFLRLRLDGIAVDDLVRLGPQRIDLLLQGAAVQQQSGAPETATQQN